MSTIDQEMSSKSFLLKFFEGRAGGPEAPGPPLKLLSQNPFKKNVRQALPAISFPGGPGVSPGPPPARTPG